MKSLIFICGFAFMLIGCGKDPHSKAPVKVKYAFILAQADYSAETIWDFWNRRQFGADKLVDIVPPNCIQTTLPSHLDPETVIKALKCRLNEDETLTLKLDGVESTHYYFDFIQTEADGGKFDVNIHHQQAYTQFGFIFRGDGNDNEASSRHKINAFGPDLIAYEGSIVGIAQRPLSSSGFKDLIPSERSKIMIFGFPFRR